MLPPSPVVHDNWIYRTCVHCPWLFPSGVFDSGQSAQKEAAPIRKEHDVLYAHGVLFRGFVSDASGLIGTDQSDSRKLAFNKM